MTPAEELRTAAAKLREQAKDATRGPWVAYATVGPRNDDHAWTLARLYCDKGGPDGCEPDCGATVLTTGAEGCEEDNVLEGDARWMELAHPGLAEPLAMVLEDAVKRLDFFVEQFGDRAGPVVEYELRVARVINGGEPR